MTAPLRVDHPADGVTRLTLALPDRRNAMTAELTAAWAQEVPRIAADRSVRAVVVTGEGSAFCAGGDLSWLEAGSEDGSNTPDLLRARMLPFYRSWLTILQVEVPVLAAVNGPAVGAGLCLALACDLRYAAPNARFSVPFTALGMHPGMAATHLLPEVIGLPRAREMFFTGRRVDAAEAERIGLVNGVLPAETLVDDVVGIAAEIAATAPVATRLTTVALRRGHTSVESALEWDALAQPITLATEDIREGLRAQTERRPASFTGR